jgi:mono/diheme cytochrome c family protein
MRYRCLAILLFHATILALLAQPAVIAATQPSNVAAVKQSLAPNYSQAGQSLPDSVIAWDAVTESEDATVGQDFARFSFSFTNVSAAAVTILSVHPSCGCTTAELPPVPWTIPAGSTGQIKVSVNLAGKSGALFKTVNVATDKGGKILTLRINVVSPPKSQMTEAQRAAGIAAAKVDRQAVFKGECASCHLKNVQTSYGKTLYAAACAICHEANPRATMVPDLHNLPRPTNLEFWRAWIASGKVGTLMPAFAASEGGPLNDAQVASLAAYLNTVIPSHVPPSSAK